MAYEHPVGRGSLFKNDRRERAEQPSYKGSINVDGTVWEISAWVSETKGGDKYFSLQVKPPYVKSADEKYRDAAQPVSPASTSDPLDEEIPFK